MVAGGARGLDLEKRICIESDSGVVGIHDGVRPWFDLEMVRECFENRELNSIFFPFSTSKND